jgi:Large polyvalent protein associated domain 39
MARVSAEYFRNTFPELKDAPDTEIAQLVHKAYAPGTDYRKFEDQFLGKASATREGVQGLKRGGIAAKAGLDMAAGGLAGVFGDDKARDEAFASYDQNMAAINRLGPRRRFKDIESAGDAVDWAAGLVGEAIPALLPAGAGTRAALAASALPAMAQGVKRTQELIPNASSTAQAAALAGNVAVNTVADALIPGRIASGMMQPGWRGVRNEIAQGAAMGAATPIAERGIAAAASGDSQAWSRGGSLSDEMIEGAAGGGVTAGVARPVVRGAQWAGDKARAGAKSYLADKGFGRFGRTETGEVDLTKQVSDLASDPALLRPAVDRNGPPTSVRTLDRSPDLPRGETLDMFGGEGSMLRPTEDPAPQGSMDGVGAQLDLFSATGLRRAADAQPRLQPGDTPDMFGGEGLLLPPREEAAPAQARPLDTTQIDLFSATGRAATDAAAMRGAQQDMFGGDTMPLDLPPPAERPMGVPARDRRQGALDFTGQEAPPRGTIYVDRAGRPVSPDVALADPALVRQAEQRQAAARMDQAKPGQVPDLFGGEPSAPRAAAEAPADPVAEPDLTGQRELPGMVTKASLLRELQAASTETGVAAFRGGEPMGGKSAAGLRAILDAPNPVAAMRDAFADGGHPKAELLDKWHERLTGRKISEPAPAPAPVAEKAAGKAAPLDPEAQATSAKFAPDEDFKGRAMRGLQRLHELAKRATSDDDQWVLREEIKDFSAMVRDKRSDVRMRETLSSLENAVQKYESYLRKKGDLADGAEFSPSYRRADNAGTVTKGAGDDGDATRAGRGVPARRSGDAESGAGVPGRQVGMAPAEAVGRLREAIARDIGETLPPYAIRPAVLRDKAVARLASVFGLKVHGFVTDGRKSLAWVEGATKVADTDGAVFIHANASSPARLVFGHELVHQIRETAPGLYDRLVDAMQAFTHADKASAYVEGLKKRGYDPVKDSLPEEATANVVGHLFATDAKFVREFGRRSPEFIRPLLDTLNSLLDTVKSKLGMGGAKYRDPEISAMIRDLEGLTKEVGAVLKQFEKRSASEAPGKPEPTYMRGGAPLQALRFTIPDALLRYAQSWVDSGGRLINADFNAMVEATGAQLTDAQRARLMATHGDSVQMIQASVDRAKESGNQRRMLRRQASLDQYLMFVAIEDALRAGGHKTWVGAPHPRSGEHTFGGAISRLRDTAQRVADKMRADAAAEAEAARRPKLEIVGGTDTTPAETRFMRKATAAAEQGDPEAVAALAVRGTDIATRERIQDGLSSGKEAGLQTALKLMTTEQIVAQFGPEVRGSADLVEALSKKFGAPFEMAAKADAVVKRMLGLPEVARRQLADLMYAATEAEIHPDKALDDSRKEPTEADVKVHELLQKKYDALPDDAKAAYQESRKILDAQHKDIVAALRRLVSRIESDPVARKERLAEIDSVIGRARGPYFPLSRFGDFVLVAKGSASDGRSVVQHFETKSAMERARAEMIAAGTKPEQLVMTRRDEARFSQTVSTPFVESLRQAIDDNVEDHTQRQAMTEALNELVIRSLPAASGAKNFIRRRNVEGYSVDAARTLADSVVRAERYVANLNFTPDVNAALADLKQFHSGNADKMPVFALVTEKDGAPVATLHDSVSARLRAQDKLDAANTPYTTVRATVDGMAEALAKAAPGFAPEQLEQLTAQATKLRDAALGANDMTRAQAVANHLIEKATALSLPKPDSEVLKTVGQVAHVAFLGLSPAYWITNLSQVPLMTFPELGGKYGAAATAREIGAASKAASHAFKLMADHMRSGRGAGVDLDKIPGLAPDERAALRHMADRGMLDITQNVDLLAVADGESRTKRAALEYITAGAHYTELFNRITTGLAAYRLARGAGQGEQQAMTSALGTVSRTQFNYAEWNKPRAFQTTGPLGQLARPLLMFQQYAQNVMYWWGANIKTVLKDAEPAERKAAGKAMLLAGAGLTVVGGAAALPLAGTVHLLANLVGQLLSDDPGFDAEDALQEQLAEVGMSPEIARAVTRGAFTMAGVDLSGRVGQGDLLPGLNQRAAESAQMAKDPTTAWLASLTGPVGSLLSSNLNALSALRQGEYVKALEAFPVKGVADLARAANLHENGVKSRDGLTLVPPDKVSSADVVLRGVGFQPESVAQVRADGRQTKIVGDRLSKRKSELVNAVVRAAMAGDRDSAIAGLESVRKFNEAIGERYPQAVIDRDQLNRAVTKQLKEQQLLMLTGGRARDRQAAMLAMQLNPGLIQQVQEP